MKHIEDWERIQYVLNSYDTIQFAGSTSAFTITKKNGQQKSAPTVIYSKAINGTFYVVEAVPDTKRRCVVVTSAYTSNKREATTHTMHSPAETSETYSADFSINNIPENSIVNNAENVNNLQNEADSAAAKAEKTQAEVPDGNNKEKRERSRERLCFCTAAGAHG